MANRNVRMRLWESGAYALSSVGPDGRGALVEHDGHDALHVVGVTAEGFEETVVQRRNEPDGVVVVTSRLHGTTDGDLRWERTVERTGLTRTEAWSAPPGEPGSWQREEVRPERTTRYEHRRDGTTVGTTTLPDGSELWHSEWTPADDGATWTGHYADAEGEALGDVEISGAGGETTAMWSGPVSTGALVAGEAEGTPAPGVVVRSNLVGRDAHTTDATHWENGAGSALDIGAIAGAAPARSWTRVTSTDDHGGTTSLEWGTERDADGATTGYTVNGHEERDGRSSFARTDERSWTLVTRSVGRDGTGVEHVTSGTLEGAVTDDHTSPVQGGDGASLTPPHGDGGDPNDPNLPEQPEHPETPHARPGGIAGTADGDYLESAFRAAYDGELRSTKGGPPGEHARALLETLGAAVTAGGSRTWSGSDLDDPGRPILDTRLEHLPSGGGEEGAGDEPRSLLAMTAGLAASAAVAAGSADLISFG